jgi:hypothetical protein
MKNNESMIITLLYRMEAKGKGGDIPDLEL